MEAQSSTQTLKAVFFFQVYLPSVQAECPDSEFEKIL